MKNNLKSIRERLELSQVQLAVLLGVSQGNISLCELQKQEVSPEIARRVIALCEQLGHPVTFNDIYRPAAFPGSLKKSTDTTRAA